MLVIRTIKPRDNVQVKIESRKFLRLFLKFKMVFVFVCKRIDYPLILSMKSMYSALVILGL